MCDVWCDGWWWVVVCGGVWWCVVWCDVMLPWGCRGDFVMVPWCAAFLLNGVLCYSSVIMALCSEHIIWACARKTRSSPVVALCSTEYDAIVCSKRYGILRRWLCNKFGTESENHTNRNRGPCFVRFLEKPETSEPIFKMKGASKPNFHITSGNAMILYEITSWPVLCAASSALSPKNTLTKPWAMFCMIS